jgi:hypothetical protein
LEVLFNHQISEQLIEDALLMVKGGTSLKDINVSEKQIQIIQEYVDEGAQKEATAYQIDPSAMKNGKHLKKKQLLMKDNLRQPSA